MTEPREEEVAALEAQADEESVAALHRLAEDAGHRGDKELRREVRRAFYRLEQRGVATGRAGAKNAAPTISRPFAGEQGLVEAYFSPPDPLGDRLFWILRQRSEGGLLHMSLLVNEPEGMREAILARTSRKDLKRLRQDMAERHGFSMIPVSPAYAAWIACEGYERARSRGTVPPSATSFPTFRLQLGLEPPAEVPALAIPGLDPDEVGADAQAGASSVELLEQELRPWFPPLDRLVPWTERLREIRETRIVLDSASQQSRVEDLVHQATVEVFSIEGVAPTWKRRLEEVAFVLAEAGQAAAARKALAAAIAYSRPAAENPFAHALVRRTFALLTAEEVSKQVAERESSLLVTPDQLRTESVRRRR